MSVDYNFLAVLAATAATIPVGAIWYELLFKKQFRKLAKLDKFSKEQEKKTVQVGMTITFLSSFITASVMLYVATYAQNFYGISFMEAALKVALMVWIGFFAFRVLMHDTFEDRPVGLTAIHTGYDLVCFVVSAAVLGLMI